MGQGVVGALRTTVSLFTGGGSPQAVAFGGSLGMMIGLMPKGNLTAAVLSFVLLATHTNLAAAALSGAVFSLAAKWTDPLAHRIGSAILTQPSWQKDFARLFDLPIVPWTALNSTVVLGSLVLSLVLFYAVYHLTWEAFSRHQPKVAQKLQEYHADKVLAGTEAVTRHL